MSALLRLYPRSWRERYEREFLGLLEARPPSLGDRVDIVRGAVDARLNLGAPHETDRSSRVTAAAAIAGGSLWVAWFGAFAGLAATQWQDPSVTLQAVPYGIVWILIGGTIAVRGWPRAAVEGPNAGSGG